MEMYFGPDALPDPPIEPIATLGNFDGVHRGHQAILARIREEANRVQTSTMIVTFHPHPSFVLRPEEPAQPIMSLKQRLKRFWDLGVDHCLVLPFDDTMAAMTAGEFVEEILWEALKLHGIYVGPFVSFGHKRGGDLRYLMSEGHRLGFRVGMVDPIVVDGTRVSSSAIRRTIIRGDLEQATRLLGRHHRVVGDVIEGDKQGRELGFPTANLEYDGSLLPPHGVYAAWAHLPDGRHPAVVNIGIRPTVAEDRPELRIEGHIIGYEADLYGEEAAFALVRPLRGEVKFSSVKALQRQIKRDVAEAKRALGILRPRPG